MSERLDVIAAWKPRPSSGLESDINKYGFPTVIHRTPSRLVEECEKLSTQGFCLQR